ncbi:MAG: hypothetical protein JSS62_01165 [Verrucomicrobia bacterium]|nr:hypothetical protein [Verrucomicrobiota bacterium]MBS0646078.1 hypothetical protein [Verrucomicrobiota bacterium]
MFLHGICVHTPCRVPDYRSNEQGATECFCRQTSLFEAAQIAAMNPISRCCIAPLHCGYGVAQALEGGVELVVLGPIEKLTGTECLWPHAWNGLYYGVYAVKNAVASLFLSTACDCVECLVKITQPSQVKQNNNVIDLEPQKLITDK